MRNNQVEDVSNISSIFEVNTINKQIRFCIQKNSKWKFKFRKPGKWSAKTINQWEKFSVCVENDPKTSIRTNLYIFSQPHSHKQNVAQGKFISRVKLI